MAEPADKWFLNDIVQDVDGYFYYLPTGQGHLSPHDLRAIADHLDEVNAPWDAEINAYFGGTE